MSISSFEIIKKIGEGAYSQVFKVRRKSDDIIYALKKVRIMNLNEKEKENALNEVRILASIHHPNVISYKEAFIDDETCSLWYYLLSLIMEYADGGDLYQRILDHQRKGNYMNEKFIWNLFIQLTRGLKALHDLNILHRDLKSANVFLNSDGTIKLGDMNVSKVAKNGFLSTQTGTPYYASPEVWRDKPYNKKSDIWSLGCVLYECLSLKPPFRADSMQGLYKRVTKGEYKRIPKMYSVDLHNLISVLLQVSPSRRPSCGKV